MKECVLCIKRLDDPHCPDCGIPSKPIEMDETRDTELVRWFLENDPVLADAALVDNPKKWAACLGAVPSIVNDRQALKTEIGSLLEWYGRHLDAAGSLYGLAPEKIKAKVDSDENAAAELLGAVKIRIFSYIQRRKYGEADPFIPIENRYIAWRIRETAKHPEMSKLLLDPESRARAENVLIEAVESSGTPMDIWTFQFMKTVYQKDAGAEMRLLAVRHILVDDETREALVKKLLDSGRIRGTPPMTRQKLSKSVLDVEPQEKQPCGVCEPLSGVHKLCRKHMYEMVTRNDSPKSGCLVLLAMAGIGVMAILVLI